VTCSTSFEIQHCELSDANAIAQSKIVEVDVARLSSSHDLGKATVLIEYVAEVDERQTGT